MFVAAEMIRPLESTVSSPSRSSSRLDDARAEYDEGDKVEVLYKGKGTKWFPGKISRVNRDGTFDIRFVLLYVSFVRWTR